MILVTGALGFLGREIIASLDRAQVPVIRCLVRPGSQASEQALALEAATRARLEFFPVSFNDPERLTEAFTGISVAYHAAAAMSGSHASMVNDTVVGSEALFRAAAEAGVDRIVLVSSFAVIGVGSLPPGGLVDESTPLETHAELRDPYSFSKLRQEELAWQYARNAGLPLVVVRPGVIFGSARPPMSPRIGFEVFGVFLHIGGKALVPLTYVENCADAVVAAGFADDVVGEVFCVVDDSLPSSGYLLDRYRRQVESLRVLRVPRWLLSLLSFSQWQSLAMEPPTVSGGV